MTFKLELFERSSQQKQLGRIENTSFLSFSTDGHGIPQRRSIVFATFAATLCSGRWFNTSLKRVAFDRPHVTRFRLLFMHVVIAKPLHTLGSRPEGMLLRDMHYIRRAPLLALCRQRLTPVAACRPAL
ncbi:hypothetical protein MES5069_490062 [Mesorhizobium escarrei]|uniref:Uncharacterized protein n=1 Tax=Mesorhizobium escarrei TaxID=666018 RepID=A0ABN8K667_9HYPH|nr:hypothetical protein MES5069_490062 [Mesorhizobium escarrei]